MAWSILFVASLLGGFLLPWWWPAPAAYLAGFFLSRSSGSAFASGFLGTAAAWGLWAAILDWRNRQLLSTRMAEIFHLPAGWAVVLATGLVGGLIGGLAAWAGFALRAYAWPRPAAPSAKAADPAPEPAAF
jgi:hypothetical protein